jgi:hypothetical protein
VVSDSVISDIEKKNSDIGRDYAMMDLTLDMAHKEIKTNQQE